VSRNLGLYKKQKYANGIVKIQITANNIKLYLHVGINPNKNKAIGAPAHTIVSILMEIVLNRTANLVLKYLKFRRCKCRQWFSNRKGRSQ
jgi:hypothetical protein